MCALSGAGAGGGSLRTTPGRPQGPVLPVSSVLPCLGWGSWEAVPTEPTVSHPPVPGRKQLR